MSYEPGAPVSRALTIHALREGLRALTQALHPGTDVGIWDLMVPMVMRME